tara:strand:- start:3356 stop:3910 length:555 start_codon:yes stop_codon:yes gene_type:complete
MKKTLLIIIILFLSNCNKPKTVLICGDHVCVNKVEAKQYFEENLSIEVKVINKQPQKEINLVELNLRNNEKGKREISLSSKSNTNKKLKTLSNKEIVKIKKEIKNKKKLEKNKKIKKRKLVKKIVKENQISQNENKVIQKNINRNYNDVVDVCTILQKCSIDEISKYLIEQGKKKKFPDITIRQ